MGCGGSTLKEEERHYKKISPEKELDREENSKQNRINCQTSQNILSRRTIDKNSIEDSKHLENSIENKEEELLLEENQSRREELEIKQGQTEESIQNYIDMDQESFQLALKYASRAMKKESLLEKCNKNVTEFIMKQALPNNISLMSVLARISHVKLLDVSNNNLAPPSCRLLLICLRNNRTVEIFNMANNKTDTDTAKCIADLIDCNKTIKSLDISDNVLGKDFFSRCSSDQLKKNVTLEILRCESIGHVDMSEMSKGIKCNRSLTEVIFNYNQLNRNCTEFAKNLTEWMQSDFCSLKVLSLKGCDLSSNEMKILIEGLKDNKGLEYLNMSANQLENYTDLALLLAISLSHPRLRDFFIENMKINSTDGASTPRNVDKLTNWNWADCDKLEEYISYMPKLKYLNIRNSSIGKEKYFTKFLQKLPSLSLVKLILDGNKLSNSTIVENLAKNGVNLEAISLSNCSLTDKDIVSIGNCLKSGSLKSLQMIKLSANRLKDTAPLLCSKQLRLLDLSINEIPTDGATALANALTEKTVSIETINISNNQIEIEGLQNLILCLNKTSLKHLNIADQCVSFDEDEIERLYDDLATAIDIKLEEDSNSFKSKEFFIKMTGLGGFTNEKCSLLNCQAIQTDYKNERCLSLNFNDICSICVYLRGYDNSKCMITQDEWKIINDAAKSSPAWLQIPSNLERTIFVSNVPASATVRTIEDALEADANCNVVEIFMCIDQISKSSTGASWILLKDQKDVSEAMKWYHSGKAKIRNESIKIGSLDVTLTNIEDINHLTKKAEEEIERRKLEQIKLDKEHRDLIQRSYRESQERHAYRLAHPAYADGRIW
ncbi:DgyrCDS12907 [Dimorphilus gyrociliatus]|uniref:DgyrCDS12907 n=1 Tax=Dimorphilus gyrociliatus TaxID=2664684 RepID=A0A7I8W936_9ANNE|nr:DgyrCDS12907 [Dimorphilus gyrociliatus]